MKKTIYQGVAGALMLASAQAGAMELKGVIGMGLDFGGDTIISGNYTDGSSWQVNAGQGLSFNGGVVVVTGDFETQATVGYKFGGPTAKNGTITLDVIPVEVMEFYRTEKIRMGAGISYQSSPKMKIDVSGSGLNGDYKFKDTTGLVVQVGWAPRNSIYSIDLRYTAMKYTPSNFGAGSFSGAKDEYSASVFGLYASLFF